MSAGPSDLSFREQVRAIIAGASEMERTSYYLGNRTIILITDPDLLHKPDFFGGIRNPVIIIACPLRDIDTQLKITGSLVVLCNQVSTKKSGSIEVVASRILHRGDESIEGNVSLMYDEGEEHTFLDRFVCHLAIPAPMAGAFDLLSEAIKKQRTDKRNADENCLKALSRLYELAHKGKAETPDVARFFGLKLHTVTRVALAKLA